MKNKQLDKKTIQIIFSLFRVSEGPAEMSTFSEIADEELVRFWVFRCVSHREISLRHMDMTMVGG